MITAPKRALIGGVVFALVCAATASAQEWFDLRRYGELKGSDRATLEFVLGAMYESVFYAQGSVGTPVICASPQPISGPRLIELMEREIAAPTNPMRPQYADNDYVAFVLMNALKIEGACK